MPSMTLSNAPEHAVRKGEPAGRLKSTLFFRGDGVVLLGSALYLLLFFRHPYFSPDSGYIALGAERIVGGQVPFRDFFSELGPGTYYLQALIFKLLGVGLFAVNVTVWLTALATSWLIYRLGKSIIDGPLAILPSFFFITICYPISSTLSHHSTGNLIFLLTLLCVAYTVSRTASCQPRQQESMWLVAGLLSGVTVLFMQSKGILAALLGPAYLFLAEKICCGCSWAEAVRRGWKQSAWFLGGFAGILAATTLFFARGHAAQDWLYDNFIFLLTNYWPYVNPPGSLWDVLIHPVSRLLADLSPAYFLHALGYYFFMLAGPGTVLVGAVWGLRNFRDSENLRARLVLLCTLGSFGAFFSELHSANLGHFVQGGVLLAPLLLSMYQSLLRRNPGARRILVVGAGAIGVFVVLGAGRGVSNALKRDTPVTTRRGTLYVTPEDAGVLVRWIDVIQSRVPAGGETFTFMSDANLYFVTATRNPTRFDTVFPGFHTSSQIEEVTKTLLRRRPQFVFNLSREELPIAQARFLDEPTKITAPHPLEVFLQSRDSPYRLEQEVDSMEVWTLKK